MLRGGAGSDAFDGTPQRDRYWGYGGADNLHGRASGRGNDRFWGARGADVIKAGRGADRLNGGPGSDTMLAGRDDGTVDSIDCGSGNADHAVIHTGDTAVNCELVDTVP